jgi:ligand-binding SRPBCC domain-containing protein
LGKVTSSIEIAASPEKVYAFVIDMKKMNDACKEYYVGKWTSDGPIGLGSTANYVGMHKYNKREEWNAKVTEFAKNKSLTMLLKAANEHSHDQTNYHTFEPTSKGTKFTISMEYEMPSIGGKLLQALGGKRMVEGWLVKVAENVKKAVETS